MCTEDTPGRITLTANTALVGEFRSSGYREPPGLVARGDGQMVRLPQLLYLVARLIDEHRDDADLLASVAAHATRESGVDLTAVTTYRDGTAAPQTTDYPTGRAGPRDGLRADRPTVAGAAL